MFRSHRILCSFLATLVLCLSTAVLAKADPLVVTITNPSQSVLPGGTVIFSGNIFNPNNVPVTMTGLLFVSGGVPITFLFVPAGFPQNPVPAMTTVSGNIVGFNIAANFAPATYSPRIGVTDANNLFSSNLFPLTLTVLEPVPEPTTLLLFGCGLAALGSRRLRRKFTKR